MIIFLFDSLSRLQCLEGGLTFGRKHRVEATGVSGRGVILQGQERGREGGRESRRRGGTEKPANTPF